MAPGRIIPTARITGAPDRPVRRASPAGRSERSMNGASGTTPAAATKRSSASPASGSASVASASSRSGRDRPRRGAGRSRAGPVRSLLMALLVWLPLAGCAGPLSTLDPAGPAAGSIAMLFWVMLAGSALLFALVIGLLVTWLLVLGTKESATVNAVLVAIKVVTLTIFIVLAMLAGFLCWRGWLSVPVAAGALGGLLGVALVAFMRPHWLRGPYRLGMRVSHALGCVVAPLVLGVIFFLVVTPLGLVLRLLGKDLLRLRRDPQAPTYWQPVSGSNDLGKMF